LIYSLVGQSEVLTISGTILLLNQHGTLGSCMIVLGMIGALARYGSNMGIVQKHLDNDESSVPE